MGGGEPQETEGVAGSVNVYTKSAVEHLINAEDCWSLHILHKAIAC